MRKGVLLYEEMREVTYEVDFTQFLQNFPFFLKCVNSLRLQIYSVQAVLGICDILVRIQIRGFVPLTDGYGYGSDSSLQRLQGCKKNCFHIFSYNLSAGTLSSVFNLLR